MARRTLALDLLAAAVLLTGLGFAAVQLQDLMVPLKKDRPPATALVPSSSAARFVALGYDNAFADMLWIRSIQYLHDEFTSDRALTLPLDQKAPFYPRMTETITDLDPYFHRAYYFATLFLSILHRWSEARAILEKGKARHPDTYYYPYELGTHLYFEKQRPDETAQDVEQRKDQGLSMYREALTKKDCPSATATFIRNILIQGGSEEAMFQLLLQKYREDRPFRDFWRGKLEETVADVWFRKIQLAIQTHRRQTGVLPEDLLDIKEISKIGLRKSGVRGPWQVYETAPFGAEPLAEFTDVFFYDPEAVRLLSRFALFQYCRTVSDAIDQGQKKFEDVMGRRAKSLAELDPTRSIQSPIFGSYSLNARGRFQWLDEKGKVYWSAE